MKRNKNKKLISMLVIVLLSIGLGYALLTQDLTINGTTKVKGNTWDIHFNNVQINSSSVALSSGDVAASINQTDNTLVEYTVTLNTPGDFYEFTVDAVNAGTVDGMIGSIISKLNGTVISSTNPLPVYLDYSVTYSDGMAIENNHLLEAGTTETYKVRLEFKRDIENNQLPGDLQNNTFSFGVNYIQSDSNAEEVLHPQIVYTGGLSSDDKVYIGSPIPNTLEQFSTADETKADIGQHFYGNEPTPFVLKNTVVNNNVADSVIELQIYDRYLTMSPDLTVGTYYLKGIRIVDDNFICLEEYYDSASEKCIDPQLTEMKAYLQTIFGASNCEDIALSDYYGDQYYSCNMPLVQGYSNMNVKYNNGIIRIDWGLYSCESNGYYARCFVND